MIAKTISQAIVEVLKKERLPMTTNEIYNSIKKNDLYIFKSKSPVGVVATEIRRHCEGSVQLSKREILFVRAGNNKYWLAGVSIPR